MIPVTNMKEALVLLITHAIATADGESVDETYVRDWVRWTTEETKETHIDAFQTIPLHLTLAEGAIDVREYDRVYGENAAKTALERVMSHEK